MSTKSEVKFEKKNNIAQNSQNQLIVQINCRENGYIHWQQAFLHMLHIYKYKTKSCPNYADQYTLG